MYFLTLTIVDRVDVFTRRELVEESLVDLRYCHKQKGQTCSLPSSCEAGLVSELDHYRLSSAHPEHALELNGYEQAKDCSS